MADWQKGKTLHNGKYTIVKELGQGGFGVTFLAKSNRGKKVVIKTLNEKTQQDPYFDKIRLGFYNEALRIAQCKSDENDRIVKIYKVIEEDKLPCIVMEYVEGEDLGKIVGRDGALPEADAVTYIKQIGEALISIHQQGFLHRDIKPSNIIVRSDKSGAVLIDFGTAREFDLNETLTTCTAYSSWGYTPAEQYNPRAQQGPYTDVYALAGTLYFLMTEKIPPHIINRNSSDSNPDPLKPLKTAVPTGATVSDRVNLAVMKGLSVSAKDRPQTVEEFLALLIPNYKSPKHQPAAKSTLLINQDSRNQQSLKNPILLGVLGTLFVGIVGSIYLILSSEQQQEFTSIELFEPQKGKIKLLYPDNWKIHREPITNELGKFISPIQNDDDLFQESLIISVEGSDLSLEQF